MPNSRDPIITVVIASSNRPQSLTACLEALRKSRDVPIEVIVVVQGKNSLTAPQKAKFQAAFSSFQYVLVPEKNKSKALNRGISMAKAPLIAFTDDDCLPDQDWLKEIVRIFTQYPDVAGVFGQTRPFQPEKHHGFRCPSSFKNVQHPQSHRITKPGNHGKMIGVGNNMAFRKRFFQQVGNFKEWLGPGSVGQNCEDGEIALRGLTRWQQYFYSPDMVVFHNRWLTPREYDLQYLYYQRGEMACYLYFVLQGYRFARPVIRQSWQQFWTSFGHFLSAGVRLHGYTPALLQWTLLEFWVKASGAMTGFYFWALGG